MNLKKVNQFISTPKNGLLQYIPSVKEQVGNWTMEEIRFLEKGTLPLDYANTLTDPDIKIHTSLSVAKLVVIFRLLVVDKIIINRTVAPMLRIVTKIFLPFKKMISPLAASKQNTMHRIKPPSMQLGICFLN